jgi:hypothetical protein
MPKKGATTIDNLRNGKKGGQKLEKNMTQVRVEHKNSKLDDSFF